MRASAKSADTLLKVIFPQLSAFNLQQLPLPVHQLRRVPVPVARQVAEDGFGRDERGVKLQLVRVAVADFSSMPIAASTT